MRLLVPLILCGPYFTAVLGKIEQLPLPGRMQACFNSYSQRTSITKTVGESISSFCFDQYMWKSSRNHGWSGFNLTREAYNWANSLLSMSSFNFRKKRQARPLRIRKEYRRLTDYERANYHRAIQLLKADTSVPPNRYDALSAIHQGLVTTAAHGGPNFLGFHRIYLLMYENALREKVPSVTVPFWDSTMDELLEDSTQSVIFTETFLGDGNGLVNTGPFANWGTMSGPLTRNIGQSGQLFRRDDMERILALARLEEITEPNAAVNSSLEFHHNGIHLWIDGQMGSLNTAAHDPVFWMHHAYVDYIWEQFRHNQRARGIDPTYDYPTYVEDPMHMPDAPLGLSNFRNIDGLSDVFTEIYYTYEPSPECFATRPHCGSPYLRCMSIRGRARCVSADRSVALRPFPIQEWLPGNRGPFSLQNSETHSISDNNLGQAGTNGIGIQQGIIPFLQNENNSQQQISRISHSNTNTIQQANINRMQIQAREFRAEQQNRFIANRQQQLALRASEQAHVAVDNAQMQQNADGVIAGQFGHSVVQNIASSGFTQTNGRNPTELLRSMQEPKRNSAPHNTPIWVVRGLSRQNAMNLQVSSQETKHQPQPLNIHEWLPSLQQTASILYTQDTQASGQSSNNIRNRLLNEMNRKSKKYGNKVQHKLKSLDRVYSKIKHRRKRADRYSFMQMSNLKHHQIFNSQHSAVAQETHPEMQRPSPELWNILQNTSTVPDKSMCPSVPMSRGYQNTFNINGRSDIGQWVYIPVKIVYQRPPTYSVYRSFPIIDGHLSEENDIYAPNAYVMIRDYLLPGKPASYSKCAAEQESGAGKVYINSKGINYMGTYKEYAVVDHRLAISIATAYVAVKSPEFGASEVFLSAYDSCGRVCQPFCKAPGSAGFSRCSGAIRITSDAPKMYGTSYGEAVTNLWQFSQGGGCPSMSDANIQLQFYCSFRDAWPF